ncbi:MAG: hypothetical protein ABF536_07865 [Liquorilactobacillus mali]|uniref:hypothetical protein n=1 Tax=Liquorilactobacillus mali TaxID=1618 RepID=UPI0039EB79BE
MKQVNDERLKIEYLKSIKQAFLVENLVLLIFLVVQAYDSKSIFDSVLSFSNPLYSVFMIGMISFGILSQKVTAAMDDKPKMGKIKLFVIFLITFAIANLFFYVVMMPRNAFISTVCGLFIALVVIGVILFNNHYRDI